MPDHKAFALALTGRLLRHKAEWPEDVQQAVQEVHDALRSGDRERVIRARTAAAGIYAAHAAGIYAAHAAAYTASAAASAASAAASAAYATAHAAYAAYAASAYAAKQALPKAEHPAVDALVALYLR
jgi:hypothetical protein